MEILLLFLSSCLLELAWHCLLDFNLPNLISQALTWDTSSWLGPGVTTMIDAGTCELGPDVDTHRLVHIGKEPVSRVQVLTLTRLEAARDNE